MPKNTYHIDKKIQNNMDNKEPKNTVNINQKCKLCQKYTMISTEKLLRPQ